MFERFSLVRCEDALPYLASIRGIVGNYQDDKDILTTGLVFNDKTLNLYKNSFLYKQSIHEFKRGGENFKVNGAYDKALTLRMTNTLPDPRFPTN